MRIRVLFEGVKLGLSGRLVGSRVLQRRGSDSEDSSEENAINQSNSMALGTLSPVAYGVVRCTEHCGLRMAITTYFYSIERC